jgi:phosphoribosylformylglycinamidine synthase
MQKVKFGIVVFPGSNCDHDTEYVCNTFPESEAVLLWHKDTDLQNCDVVILPGGFSYGDYLRAGAIAKFSPIMNEVIAFAAKGYPVLGICNGFQVLLECGLLQGAMMHNKSHRFICKTVNLKTTNTQTRFTSEINPSEVLRIPIAHGEGNYVADQATIEHHQEHNNIIFQYCDLQGQVLESANPNGSIQNIAGICNDTKNVLGLMPHPERACDPVLGSTDGIKIFQSIIKSLIEAKVS